MTEPLSPAAEAVLRADAAARCLFEWDSVNDPPCHPSDHDWNGCIRCVNRLATAAALRAAADQVVPEQSEPPCGEGEPWPQSYQLMADSKWEQRQKTRAELLAIAAELEAH